MRKIWTLIGSLLILTGLKSQETIKVKKETTPVRKSDKKAKTYKGEVIPKLESEINRQSGMYVKVDEANRKEALKGHVYLKVEGPIYGAASEPYVYLKVDAASIPKSTGLVKYIKGESPNKGFVYLKMDGIKGESSAGEASSGEDFYLKVEGKASERKNGFIYLKVDGSSMNTAAAADYYLKIGGIKGETNK